MPRLIAALLAAFMLAGPASAEHRPQRVLAVFAHPDDELVVAPALAALARQGDQVTILFATSGDQGPGVTDLARGPGLGAIRRGEATCSAQALGAEVRFLDGLGDGSLAATPQARDSSAKNFLDQFAAVYLLITPDLVITWGPDGGYGHADHRMVSALVTEAEQTKVRQNGARLLYVGIRAGTLPPLADMQGWAVTDPALLTEQIGYTPADLAAATAAAQCHETQFDAATRAGMMPLFDATIWQGAVHFRRAFHP